MLYDPKWKRRLDPFSLASLIAWLEAQDPAAEYCYSNTGECLLARYFAARGFNKVIMAARFFYHFPRACAAYDIAFLPPHFNDIAKGAVRTFGAALARARALAAAEQVAA
ncbi:MAG: hypothetical protein KGL96_05280 [Hyphomicrobiales bacterium]|nr:hypothetical protein [Hyphomicrobiales bacterium]